MAELSPAQRMIADQMLSRTFESVGAPPSYIQPPQSVEEMYAGILPKSVPNPIRGPTAAQTAAMGAIPPGSYRAPQMIPNRSPTIPFGSQFPDTGNTGRASGSMLLPVSLNRPATMVPAQAPAAGVPLPRPRPNVLPSELGYTPMEDANIAAGLKAGVPLKSVAMPRPRPGWAPTAQDVAIMKAGVARNPDLIELLIRGGQTAAPVKPVVTPQQAAQLAARAAQSKAYGATSGVPRTGRDPERESGNIYFRSGMGGGGYNGSGGGGSLL